MTVLGDLLGDPEYCLAFFNASATKIASGNCGLYSLADEGGDYTISELMKDGESLMAVAVILFWNNQSFVGPGPSYLSDNEDWSGGVTIT